MFYFLVAHHRFTFVSVLILLKAVKRFLI